jgi:general secretion pathway protein B
MSEILDALKKLDREKAARRNGTADIAVEILAPGLPRSGKKLRRHIAIVCFTAVVAAAITYAVVMTLRVSPEPAPPARIDPPASAQQAPSAVREPAPPTKSDPSAVIHRSVPKQQPAPAPREPESSSESPSPAPVSSPPPVQQVAPAPIEPALPAKPVPPASTVPSAVQSEASPAPAKVQKPVEKETSPTAVPASPAPPTTPGVAPGTGKTVPDQAPFQAGPAVTPSSFKITVIVWDEDPSKRWAMINGMKTAQGSVIEGAKVEEINLTGVRFFHNGRYVEVPMN